MEKIALIPVYEPRNTLVSLVQELSLDMKVVIVNDGSGSSYKRIFEDCKPYAHIIEQQPNLGKGAALNNGMHWIYNNCSHDSVIVTVDGDGQHLPVDCIHCGQVAIYHPESLILGTRSFSGKGVPFRSYWGNHFTSVIFQLFTHVHINDTQTGLRAFDYSLLPTMMNVEGNRYEYEMNQLLAMIEQHIPLQQVPIQTVYEDGNASSHFHVLRDSFLIYKQLIHFTASSFSSFLVDYVLFSLFSICFTFSYGTIVANIVARIFSATFNYEVNRKMVFKDQYSRRVSFYRYALLALFILICNTLLLSFFVYVLHWSSLISKILVELILFFFSYSIQKTFIFHHQTKGVTQ